MNKSTFKNWSKKFVGIETIIKEIGNGKITRGLIRKIISISVEKINQDLLATVFKGSYYVEMAEYENEPDYRTYQTPHLYIVWSNNTIEESGRIRAVSHIIPWNGSEYEYENDHDRVRALPIASHFIGKYDVKHIILVWEYGDETICGQRLTRKHNRWNIDKLKIIVFNPSEDFDLCFLSHKIIESLNEGSYQKFFNL